MSITLPYTADEFMEIIEDNASLHDTIEKAAEDIQTIASETLPDMLNQFQETMQSLLSQGAIFPTVVNESGLQPTGMYATEKYYDIDFGIKCAYDRLGNIYLIMKGGTEYMDANLIFSRGRVPSGVTVEGGPRAVSDTYYYYAIPENFYVGIIHGVKGPVELTVYITQIIQHDVYVLVDVSEVTT